MVLIFRALLRAPVVDDVGKDHNKAGSGRDLDSETTLSHLYNAKYSSQRPRTSILGAIHGMKVVCVSFTPTLLPPGPTS